MEKYIIQKEYNDDEGESTYDHREYIIKTDNKKYILRLEAKEQNIYFIVSLNDNMEYNYKTHMNLLMLTNKLELNSNRYSNFDLILKLFDKIYEKQNLFIKINNDEFCFFIIKFINVLEEQKYEFKLNKNFMKSNDKFNFLFNQIKLLKNNNIEKDAIKEMNDKINELNNKLNQKDEEIKNIINKKDIIINEMNKQIIEQDKKLKELEEKNIETTNKFNKIENNFV